MRRYFEPIARGACWVMATIVLCQAATLLLRKNPIASLAVPETFTALKALAAKSASKETNSPPSLTQGTNAPSKQGRGTNLPPSKVLGTNSAAGTNAPPPPSLTQGSNAPPAHPGGTNTPAAQSNATAVADSKPPTMPPPMAMAMPPGMVPGMPPGMAARMAGRMPPGMAMGMPMGGGMAPGKPLPPAAQAWVDKIKDSEVFGPVPRPMPMALLGIAGQDVFFRAPNGQSGVFRKGEEMGGVKLLQTSANRILVEQDGQKKELTIFSGIGSESLMPSEKNKPQ